MFFKSSLLKLSTSPLPSFTVSPELHLTSYFTKNTERIKISMSSQHQSHPPHCIWPRILYFLPSEMDDLLMLSAKSAPSACTLDPSPPKGLAAAVLLSLLHCQFPSVYWTVIPSVLSSRVASVHYLQFFCYFSHTSPPSHVLSPSLYQNYPGHKWPHVAEPSGHASVLSSSTWQDGHFLETLASWVPAIPHSPLTSSLFFSKQIFIEV